MSFAGKVVLVTGASSGIGAATAILFCKEGASVVLVARNTAKLIKVSEQCAKAGGKHIVVQGDVSIDADAKQIVDRTIAEFGQIDVLVNNAGITRNGAILDGTILETYDQVIGINLRAVIHMTCLVASHLVKTKGNIINISSIAGEKADSSISTAYSVSKAALTHFTKGAAAELAPSGVRVNAVSPGPVRTDILENSDAPVTWDIVAHITALKRVSEPEEIAELIIYLASDKARGITGSNFISDNGYLVN